MYDCGPSWKVNVFSCIFDHVTTLVQNTVTVMGRAQMLCVVASVVVPCTLCI